MVPVNTFIALAPNEPGAGTGGGGLDIAGVLTDRETVVTLPARVWPSPERDAMSRPQRMSSGRRRARPLPRESGGPTIPRNRRLPLPREADTPEQRPAPVRGPERPGDAYSIE